MKPEEHSVAYHQHNQINRYKKLIVSKLSTKTTVYILLILLTYTLGYLSAASKSPAPPSQPPSSSLSDLQSFRVTTRCTNPIDPKLVRHTILDKVFNNTSPYIDFPPPHVANMLRMKRVKGWGSNGAVFEHLIRRVKPRVIIEVGTFLGASAMHMAELTRKLGLKTDILCVDDFRGWPGFNAGKFKDVRMVNGDLLLLYQFMQNVVYFNATGSVLPVPFSSGSALQKFCEWGIQGDLIEVDAGHDFNSAWSDINRAYQIVRPGGVLFGHDYFTAYDNRGVRRAVNLFAKLHGLEIKTDGEHWVINKA